MANNIMEYIQYINNLPVCDATTREILKGFIEKLDLLIGSEHEHDMYMPKDTMEKLYVTKEEFNSIDFNEKINLDNHVSKEELNSFNYLTESNDELCKLTDVNQKIVELKSHIANTLKNYALKSDLDLIKDFLNRLEIRIKALEDDNDRIIEEIEAINSIVYHTIQYDISENITNTNNITIIEEGKTYSTVLTCDIDYTLNVVQVLMNNVDITSQCVSKTDTKAMINIENVTGPLVIKAYATIVYSIKYQTTDGVILNNVITSINAGERFTLIIDYVDGYTNDFITVTMGGVDISDSSIVSPGENQNGISIPKVTGDLVITIMAIQKTIPCTSIALYNTSVILYAINDTVKNLVTVTPPNTTDTVVWSSSNNSVATVDQTGYITAVGAGNCVVTATCGKQSATCNVTVDLSVPCTSLTCWEEVWIEEGSDAPLGVDVQPSNCTETLYWEVSDASALSVYKTTGATNDGSGNIYAHAVKAGTYTVTFHCGYETAQIRVVIESAVILCEGITVRDVTVQAKNSVQAQFTTTPINCTETLIVQSLTIANTSIAQKEGIVNIEGVSAGTTTGTLTLRGETSGRTFSDTFNITVTSIQCTGIRFDRSSQNIAYSPGVSYNLNQHLILTPSNTTDPVVWYSDNNSIPVSNGYVSAGTYGSAKIQAVCNGFAATIQISIV